METCTDCGRVISERMNRLCLACRYKKAKRNKTKEPRLKIPLSKWPYRGEPTWSVRIGEVAPLEEDSGVGLLPKWTKTGGYSEEEDEKILRMLDQGESYTMIAKALGRYPGGVAAHAKTITR